MDAQDYLEQSKNQGAKMDLAANNAAQDLKCSMTLADIQAWWRRHYLRAGHKRLARVLLEHKDGPGEHT